MTLDQLRKCVELTDELEAVLDHMNRHIQGNEEIRYCRDDVKSLQCRFKKQLARVESNKLAAMKTQE